MVSIGTYVGRRTELTLNHDIVVKFTVEPIEELHRSIGTIGSPVRGLIQSRVVVHKRAEHDNAAMRLESIRKQVL